MPRAQADIDAAVIAARDIFWRAGYDETSVEDVVAATGFNRYALYNEFGGKRDVFLATIDTYHLERKTIFLDVLDSPDRAPLDAVREVLTFSIIEMARREAGCLMCNVAWNLARRDAIVRARVETYMDEITSAFEEALSRAAARGELNPNVAPASGARLLMTLIKGLGAAAEMGASERMLMETLETALGAFSSAPQKSRTRTRARATAQAGTRTDKAARDRRRPASRRK